MEILKQQIAQATGELFGKQVSIELTTPEANFGDYSTNVALKLAKDLKKSPREVAEKLIQKLNDLDFLNKIELAGPGFINFWLKDSQLFSLISTEVPKKYEGQIVIAEYSDPNAFKALHSGHLYTTLVGNSISLILEKAGAQLSRLNYGGDVGLHAAKAIWGIVNKLGGVYPERLNEIKKEDRATWVSQCYVEGSTAYESSDVQKQEIISYNHKIYEITKNQDKSSPLAQIYWTTRQWSYDGFVDIYKKLGVESFDEFIPESLVTPIGLDLVNKGLEQGVFEKSDGAVIYSKQKSGLHTRVFVNSNGLPTYEAKELGLALYKWQQYHFDKSLVITANDITEYMKVLFKAMTNFYPEVEARTTHITHGMIKFAGGQKMSSRKGNVLMAQDVIDGAMKANFEYSGKDDYEVAISAIKYAFLKQRIGGDISFDPEESVSLQGNSGPYLQYAHARARSILAKSSAKNQEDIDNLTEGERKLVRELAKYQDVLQQTIDALMPHHICTYLYELSQQFNRFYETNKVIGDEREPIRRSLVEKYADILQSGLSLLGIKALSKM